MENCYSQEAYSDEPWTLMDELDSLLREESESPRDSLEIKKHELIRRYTGQDKEAFSEAMDFSVLMHRLFPPALPKTVNELDIEAMSKAAWPAFESKLKAAGLLNDQSPQT